jgi:parallel beta-helix repeat protein
MRARVLTVLLVATFQRDAQSAILHVPSDYPTIQGALNAAAAGDEVRVSAGTYHENVLLSPAQNGVLLDSDAGPEFTVIDGSGATSVVSASSVGSQTKVVGFTITNGHSATGGGFILLSSQMTISNCIIVRNIAGAAGGIYLSSSSATLTGNIIEDNQAPGGSGGGIYCDNSSNATITGNVIARNTCAAFGGGITVWVSSAPLIQSNTIVANQAALGGGGIYVVRSSDPTLSRNIVAGNNVGGGVVVADLSSAAILGCDDVWSNLPTNFSGLPDPTGSQGNFSLDPQFCEPVSALDLHLSPSSPCLATASPHGCSLVGALDLGCGATPGKRSTWGQIKTRYR